MKHTFIHDGRAWWLKITSQEELDAYMIDVFLQDELLATKEFLELKRNNIKGHYTNHFACVCDSLASFKDTSFFSELTFLKESFYKNASDVLVEHGQVYINSVGGYNWKREAKQIYSKEGFDFPVFSAEDIRIKKWPAGTHWYAYIGNVQLTNGEQVKWNTKEEAESFAIQYVNTKRRCHSKYERC